MGRSWWVAVIRRMSTCRSCTSPRRRKRCSSRTFSSLACTCGSASPTSSRKSVPRCATSIKPGFAATAPVKAPFSWPKSSESRRSRDRPAQLRSTKASSARGPFWCSHRARTPLPVPDSPCSRTQALEAATRRAFASSVRMASLSPRNGSTASRAERERLASEACRSRRWSISRSSTTSRVGSSTGLVRNWSAPSLIAATARSIEPWAVSITTGSEASAARSRRSTSSPSPSGSWKSTTAASRRALRNRACAWATLSASTTAWP